MWQKARRKRSVHRNPHQGEVGSTLFPIRFSRRYAARQSSRPASVGAGVQEGAINYPGCRPAPIRAVMLAH